MAEGFPSVILDTVLKQLESPLFQSCHKLNFSLHTQLRDLRSKLELIREVIDDAEWMGVLFPEIVGKWVCELQCVLYEVDDLLDEALTRSMPASDVIEKVCLHLANMPFGLTLANKMKKLNKSLEMIVEKCYECNLFVVECSLQSQPSNKHAIGGNRKPVARKGILHYDYVKDDEGFQMLGRDDDKKNVIEMLLLSGNSRCNVVYLCGEAGVGKTTLCRAVFNDVQVKDWFGIRLWFNFRDNCEEKLLSELGAVASPPDPKTDNISISRIENKRILLVVDNFEQRNFNDNLGRETAIFAKLFDMIDISYGEVKVLLPTLCTSESYISGDDYYYLKNELTENNCRSIFKEAAAVLGVDRHMVDLIVSKCMRNPALLKGVGTLLYGNGDRSKWEYFAHRFDFSGRYDNYANISRLHYSLAKSHRNDVGYLSLFSKGEFKRKSLIHQFAAHGFTYISSTDQLQAKMGKLMRASSKDNWDVEENYTLSSFFAGRILQVAGSESTTALWTEDVIHKAAQHVSIVRPPLVQQTHEIMLPHGLIMDIKHRRTILFLGDLPIRMAVQTLDMLASNLHYLRVLDLHDLALQTLPSSIGKLIHLRYLDLSRNDFKLLPRSICKLKNLQTLKLFYCDKLIRLPQHIDVLGHLKNLEISMCLDLTLMPPTIGRLTRLENLDRFVVSPHKGGLRYLERLDNLNGDLSIELPRRWKASTMEAKQAKLEEKKGLTTLRFKWPCADDGGDTDDGKDNDDVLEKLKPWVGIEFLSIVNFGGTKIPSWIMEISCLSEIVISKCKRCKMLPSFHEIPKLRRLTFASIMNVEYLQDNNSSSDVSVFFPSLEELKIGEMPKLKGWSKDLGGLPKFPDINSLSIWSCPHLTTLPPFPIIEESLTLQAVSEELVQLINGRECPIVSLISVPDMVVLPVEFVNKLPNELTIKDCKQLQMLWTDEVQGEEARASMIFLSQLSISNAPALKHMCSSLRKLSNLTHLEISGCNEELDCLYNKEEDGMPWEQLRVLYYLSIKGFQKLVALPKGFRCLRELDILSIENCNALKWEAGSLPPNLQELYITSCPLFSESNEDIRKEHPYLIF